MNHKPGREHFVYRWKNDILEVWMPPIDDPEGEFIMQLNAAYLPALIAGLKNEMRKRR